MLVKPSKVTKETYTDHYGYTEEANVAVFNSAAVTKIEKAHEKFQRQKGTFYKMLQEASNHLYPTSDDFIEYCFGEPGWDGYLIYDFEGIRGTNKNITKRLFDLFKSFEWVDYRFQKAFSVIDCGNFFVFGHDSW